MESFFLYVFGHAEIIGKKTTNIEKNYARSIKRVEN